MTGLMFAAALALRRCSIWVYRLSELPTRTLNAMAAIGISVLLLVIWPPSGGPESNPED